MKKLLLAVCGLALLSACDQPGTSTAQGVKPAAQAAGHDSTDQGGGISYEVVTVERPESVEAFHNAYRAMYDICASTRKMLNLPPPPPMKQPPADFISERSTEVSDGKAYLSKTEHFTFQVEQNEPDFTCRTYLETTTTTQLVRDGKRYHSSVDADGKRSSEPAEDWSMPRDKESDIFTEPKIVKGHAVKCMKMLPNTQNLITESCVADLKPGTLTHVGGKAITLASRITIVQDARGAILVEPVTVRVGHQVDKAIFDAAALP